MAKLIHICEVCETQAILDIEEAFNTGWDYSPRMCPFKVVAPRTCPNCSIDETVWWALVVDKKKVNQLTSKQREVLKRISKEPESILVKE